MHYAQLRERAQGPLVPFVCVFTEHTLTKGLLHARNRIWHIGVLGQVEAELSQALSTQLLQEATVGMRSRSPEGVRRHRPKKAVGGVGGADP